MSEHRASVSAVSVPKDAVMARTVEWVITCTCGYRSGSYRLLSNAAMDADLHEHNPEEQP